MRQFSNAVKALLATDNLTIFYLVSVVGEIQTIRHTTLPYDVSIPELGLFSSDNDLLATEPPRHSSVVDREAYKITYADPSFEWRAIFEQGLTGALATVYMGFINTTDANIGDADPGYPLLKIEDLVVAYSGFVDTQGHTTTGDGEVTAVIECSSPMADLDLNRSTLTSRDAMHQKHATDTSFDDVYTGSKVVDLLWGKIN